MGDIEENKVFIDELIPVERQINFLRNNIFDRDLAVYDILNEKLGEEGKKLYHLIKEKLMDKALEEMASERENYDEPKKITGYIDRILGYRVEVDYDNQEGLQLKVGNCPYFEKAKEFGLEEEICKIICDFEIEQAKERGMGELSILSKIGKGADRCTFKFKRARK